MSFPSPNNPLIDKFTFDSQECLDEELSRALDFEPKSIQEDVVVIQSLQHDSKQVHPFLIQLESIPKVFLFNEMHLHFKIYR